MPSMLPQTFSDDEESDYDLISNPDDESRDQSFSVGDLSNSASYGHVPVCRIVEPPPSQAAKEHFDTVGLSKTDIQTFVAKTLGFSASSRGEYVSKLLPHIYQEGRTVRVYADGLFDGWSAGHALQLRQAKLSFPSVYLIVGVFSDATCYENASPARIPHVERCEVVRHCRWVDEVVSDPPWAVTEAFVGKRKIDFVAVQVGASVDPAFHKERVRAYDALKEHGKVIPTRKTFGLATPLIRSSAVFPVPVGTEDGPVLFGVDIPDALEGYSDTHYIVG